MITNERAGQIALLVVQQLVANGGWMMPAILPRALEELEGVGEVGSGEASAFLGHLLSGRSKDTKPEEGSILVRRGNEERK
ncbi:MAG: hypothetical protein QG665_140 [Patescibacteria group bacterium]|nr:hypothetical protein [Patescibacteria group bacterium]